MKKILFLCFVISLGAAVNAFAIPASYGVATHDTDYWQDLSSPDSLYGVSWSTDGVTWGHETLYVGQSVVFKFDMHKYHVGTHYADHLKVWLDWDGNGMFENDEVVIYAQRPLTDSETGNMGTHNTPNQPYFSFISDSYEILDSYIGDTWLRARVTCSESLLQNWNDQWVTSSETYNNLFLATGRYYQGEVEEWKLTIAKVPEPSTFLLLASGLLGLGWHGRKRKQA